jgi:hypothetical protein
LPNTLHFRPGIKVVITIIGDFDQISAKTIAVFLKTNVMINSGCMYFESKISYCFSNISIIILNTVPCSQFGTGAQRETISFFYTCTFPYRICPQNLTDSVCDDLTNDANQDYQNEIQVKKRTRCVHLHMYTQIPSYLYGQMRLEIGNSSGAQPLIALPKQY